MKEPTKLRVVVRNETLALSGTGADSWTEALAPCKLPEVSEKQRDDIEKAIRHLSHLQDGVPKTPENYRTLLAAFSAALFELFERHPMGARFALDDFIWQTRRQIKRNEKAARLGRGKTHVGA
jgi:hypothetical protein